MRSLFHFCHSCLLSISFIQLSVSKLTSVTVKENDKTKGWDYTIAAPDQSGALYPLVASAPTQMGALQAVQAGPQIPQAQAQAAGVDPMTWAALQASYNQQQQAIALNAQTQQAQQAAAAAGYQASIQFNQPGIDPAAAAAASLGLNKKYENPYPLNTQTAQTACPLTGLTASQQAMAAQALGYYQQPGSVNSVSATGANGVALGGGVGFCPAQNAAALGVSAAGVSAEGLLSTDQSGANQSPVLICYNVDLNKSSIQKVRRKEKI
eukprot:GHVN01030959.1.p1 GENE.GHVN01030959.1~~GHVN01030959.1.p1  ORF type:complete len:266 (-),score=53.62 GHVN01030959.1:1470-2267(-)